MFYDRIYEQKGTSSSSSLKKEMQPEKETEAWTVRVEEVTDVHQPWFSPARSDNMSLWSRSI